MMNLDYYSVMQKRIEYFEKKYDPHKRYSPADVRQQEIIKDIKPEKNHNRLLEGISNILSFLF
jgi:hypothetical protein